MLCLIAKNQTPEVAVLEVHGRLADDSIEVLAAEIQRLLASSDRLVLVLDGVSFVDAAGLALLRRWSEPRLALRGGSAFVRALLAADGFYP